MPTKYISEIPYDSVTDNQVRLSTESSIDDFYRSIRDGADNVLIEYKKENSGAFGGYDQLRDSLDTLRLKSPYNNLGLDECRLVEVRSTDIKLANNGNIAFNGEVTDVIIVSIGEGYVAGELFTKDTYGSDFKASYTVSDKGGIDTITVINSGSGYVSPPTLYFTPISGYTVAASLLPVLSSSADTNNKLVLPLQLKDNGVTAGDYTIATMTVDSTGRITGAEDYSLPGTILGYTALAKDATTASYDVTTSFVVIDANAKVTFVAPASGNVEIFVSVFSDAASSRALYLGLSDKADYIALDVTHEHEVLTHDETDEIQVNHYWIVTGLTAGTSYTWWIGAKSSHSSAIVLRWGGDATAEYAPFIVKATALPVTVYDPR